MREQQERPMIGTNRDLAAMREIIEIEIRRFKAIAAERPGQSWMEHQFVSLSRQRIALCAALVNRRIEAAKKVVDFTLWVTANGALGDGKQCGEAPPPAEAGWRMQNPA